MILPGKGKTKFRLQLNNYKSKHRFFRKGKKCPTKAFSFTPMFKIAAKLLMIEKSLYLRRVKRTNNLEKEKRFCNTN